MYFINITVIGEGGKGENDLSESMAVYIHLLP